MGYKTDQRERPVGISFRKMEIYERRERIRRSGHSPLEVVHQFMKNLEENDPESYYGYIRGLDRRD